VPFLDHPVYYVKVVTSERDQNTTLSVSIHNKRISACFYCCSCKWNQELCKPEYISNTLTDMGLCYTFNANQDNILSSTETGNLSLSIGEVMMIRNYLGPALCH